MSNMREIKFRAWDAINKFMGKTFTIFDNGELPSHPIVMQYTGLKDKNGKEIYAGDILNGRILGTPFQVQWYASQFRSGFGLPTSYKELEIIGNIYENPELVEEKNNESKNESKVD